MNTQNRNYITWIDPVTHEQTSLIDQLLEEDKKETAGARAQRIEGLQPYEQYAIFQSSHPQRHLTSVDEMFDAYSAYVRKKGGVPAARKTFIVRTQEESKATLLRIGDKEYFLGLALKKRKG